MSLINPISSVRPKAPQLPESTGVLGFKPQPMLTASIFNSPGVSKGGTETTGVNSLSSPPSGCGSSLNIAA